jgi:hypothetical protein
MMSKRTVIPPVEKAALILNIRPMMISRLLRKPL